MNKGQPFLFAEAIAKLEKSGPNGRRRFSGIAYSGDRVSNAMGSDIVIDCATSRVQGESLGILYQHDPDKVVGNGKMSFGKLMSIDGELSAVTDEGKRVAALADEGFPWQLSIRVEPGEIDEVRFGTSVKVNGRTLTGPITVFRNNLIREVSFTPVGRDSKTSAEVFSNAALAAAKLTPPVQSLVMLAQGGNEHELALSRSGGSSLVRRAIEAAKRSEAEAAKRRS